jgi:hypothetical protein
MQQNDIYNIPLPRGPGGLPPTSVSFLTSEKTHVHFVTHFLKTLLLTLREMRNFTDEFSHLLDIATLQFAFVA